MSSSILGIEGERWRLASRGGPRRRWVCGFGRASSGRLGVRADAAEDDFEAELEALVWVTAEQIADGTMDVRERVGGQRQQVVAEQRHELVWRQILAGW